MVTDSLGKIETQIRERTSSCYCRIMCRSLIHVLNMFLIVFSGEILKDIESKNLDLFMSSQHVVAIFCHEYAEMILQLCSHLAQVVLHVVV